MSTTTLRVRPGPVLLLLAGLAAVLGALLDLRVPGEHRQAVEIEPSWTGGLPGLALAWAGAVLLTHEPRNRLGWVLGGFGVWWAVDGLAAGWVAYATLDTPALAGASAAYWVYQRVGAGLLLVLPLVLLLYPDGRLPAGRWRVVAVAALLATSLLPLVLLGVPARVAEPASGAGELPEALATLDLDPMSLPIADGAWEVLLRVAFLGVAISLVPAVAVVVQRYRAATGLDRTRMRWLLWAAVVDALVMLTIQLLPDRVGSSGLMLAVFITAAAVVVGITRPDVVDVDRLLGGTLLYAGLLAATFAIDVAVIGLAGWALGERLSSDQALVVAVFVVVAVYAPLRHRLWLLVRRSVVGERDDPYAVVSTLARELESSGSTDAQLLEVARAVATAFRTAYVGVEIRQASGELLLVEHGSRTGETRALPITYRDEQIGRLLLPTRGGATRLRPSDERLLADLVRQAAAAARSDRLSTELQQSRERLVTAVEDERRRLRRELHDGLGPSLAAVASRIDTARMLASKDPQRADHTLAQARSEVTGMLVEVRRLVHGLRPPALDDVGLVRAVRQVAEQLAPPGLQVRVETPEDPDDPRDLEGLPAAVEVAAFRIATEAVTNVVRHAGATRCSVRLARHEGDLVVDVVDDGRGIPADVRAGVGLVSARERAAELGGFTEITRTEPRGTRVRAVLPLSAPTLAAAVGSAEGVDG